MNKEKTRWNVTKAKKVLMKEGYTLISQYKEIKSRTEIEVRCKNGHKLKLNIYQFTVHNRRCKDCKKENTIKEANEFKLAIKSKSNDKFKVVGTYKSKFQPIEVIHKECGQKWSVLPEKFIDNIRCPNCHRKCKKKTHDQFVQEVENLVGDEYKVMSQYITIREKVSMLHEKCGNEWEVKPGNFLHNNRRCPKCNASKGELKVEKFLKSTGINYERQHRDEKCRNKKPLPFDFKVDELYIEYDGELHFEPGRFNKNEKEMIRKMNNTRLNDEIKNRYCIENNKVLIRIPYWEYENIEYILTQVLSFFGYIHNDLKVNKELVYKYLVNHICWSYKHYIEYKNTYNKMVVS